jgi:hypothetical protein
MFHVHLFPWEDLKPHLNQLWRLPCLQVKPSKNFLSHPITRKTVEKGCSVTTCYYIL